MDSQAVGIAVVAVVTSAGGVWALVQLAAWVWNKKGSSSDVEQLKDGLHKLRNTAVTSEAMRERKDEVDRQLEARRQDVIALHEKIDDHSKADQLLHNAMLDKLSAIGASVARIEGQLAK